MPKNGNNGNPQTGGVGNTKQLPSTDDSNVLKKNRIVPSKYWCFTWNNYPNDWFEILETVETKIDHYIYGKEIGESGTRHIQGYIEFKTKVRPTELGICTKIHWEKRSKHATRADNIKYCSKDGDYKYKGDCKPEPIIKVLDETKLYKWQEKVIKMIEKEPNDRTINWYWEKNGNVGKSALCKLLCYKYGALICSGKSSDMKYMIVKYHEKKGRYPEIIIFDVPRSNLEYISYTGIEEIKNGCFANSKYECDMVIMNSPHVIVFANEEPETEKMSADRWKIKNIDMK